MSDTETIAVILLETRDMSIKVNYMGTVTFLPRSQIEKLTTDDDSKAVVTIPGWLYREKFESNS